MHLPALDGRDPLGFLAALGVLRLLTDHDHPGTLLSFDPQTATAIIHSGHPDIDTIVTALGGIVSSTSEHAAIPGVPDDFPPANPGTGGDPLRVPRHAYNAKAITLNDQDTTGRAHAWHGALVTDLAVDDRGRCRPTPYTAPAGQQALRTFFHKPLTAVRRHPPALKEALTGWRRIDRLPRLDILTGESLDHRAIRDAVDQPDGESRPSAVPGATWLATMALPLLRLTSTGARRTATCWYELPGQGTEIMIWPLWRPPLDTHATQALLEHPAIRPEVIDAVPTASLTRLRPLGVITIAAARRLAKAKSDGELAPTSIQIT
ncbi:type I-G CRISPR-associated protein, Cas3-extension family [Krasilnikovia cinnamomea]|uniref:type I-G CRISPR-associated protein, Cas3-extension family n=1 Tax=Krasilnikovia cinnamomea TaxID=349313 RepID=UPI00102C3D54|nr:hypothetical protein [Krasilnikovia cinnamomea]